LAALGLIAACAAPPRTAPPVGPTHPPAPVSRPEGTTIPTRFEEGRFFARPVVAATGDALELYLDTGGNNVLFPEVVARLGITAVERGEGEDRWKEVALPPFAPGASIPPPLTRGGRVLVFDPAPGMERWAGMLGPEWFGGRCWLMDYPAHRLALLDDCETRSFDPAHTVPLGMKPELAFPSLEVTIGGETLPVLFDTGAMTTLSPAAHAALPDGAQTRAASFIVRSVYERWRALHPSWRVIENADRGLPMIRVPEVRVAGHTVGPVWFTIRPDTNFHDFMSRWTAVRVDGAIGGNVLAPFRVVVDYPRRRASFER
jgi:hypothetical protein